MKKILAIITLVVVFVCGAVSVSAATKQDLIDKLGTIPAAIENKEVFYNGAVQVINNSNFTEAQMDALLAILDEVKVAIPTNKGPAARNYTEAERNAGLTALKKGCAAVNYSYEVTTLKTAEGEADFAIKLYDNNNKLVLVYTDGIIKATGVEANNNFNYIWLAAGVLAVAAAGVVVFVNKKKVNSEI